MAGQASDLALLGLVAGPCRPGSGEDLPVENKVRVVPNDSGDRARAYVGDEAAIGGQLRPHKAWFVSQRGTFGGVLISVGQAGPQRCGVLGGNGAQCLPDPA